MTLMKTTTKTEADRANEEMDAAMTEEQKEYWRQVEADEKEKAGW
jgi:hypothetical protein